ncbi:hypothetical protein [Devosia sp. 63-57]|uniref:hypothetical protein n=1 Tax=Devosia sp. 63-57 TaxID=1895751 RepID=UPI000868373A|nr:hypothetical protein [Devosia sp. 63-57]ODT50285.1 MAG: hypothetical protein ABS74_05040 [Pelagibacterium sp. SCN 63-126]ODU82749.1 MAG: hypothetical protein ABT14_16530 [Pelagibacterium sp. SCN 63-17]OJX45029.1 MAG: hypothetical protein BGO80_04040 [Devosia sp. 63-57]
MRRAPQYHSPSIHPRAQLDPSGDHRLLVENEGSLVLADYDLGQVEQLERAIEQFKRLVTVTDGGRDFHNRRIVPIEVGR